MVFDSDAALSGAFRPRPRAAAAPATFLDWLRDSMGQRAISGSTLARRAGLPTTTVSGWLAGLGRPEEAEVPALAEALGVTIAEVQRALAI